MTGRAGADRTPLRRTLEVWGTVVTIDAVPPHGDARLGADTLDALLPEVSDLAGDIDRALSTWREDSLFSALRSGRLTEDDLSHAGRAGHLVGQVLDDCRRARALTRGSFDPWAAPGGLDPSGYVKGWGAGLMADLLAHGGLPDVCVNAAGDVAARGHGPGGTPWRIGVLHPDHRHQICAVVPVGWDGDLEGCDGAVATSGFSEQRGHVVDPATGRPPVGARQASVVGPDAGFTDALATALLVDGHEGDTWFEEFAARDLTWGRVRTRWGALVVEGDTVWRMGACALPQ